MQVSASDMRECLEGALMAILPREERIKRAAAAATSPVEWSHVRKGFAAGPPGTEEGEKTIPRCPFSGFH